MAQAALGGVGLIDIHTHVTPSTLPAPQGQAAGWPCMHCAEGRTTMMLGDKPFRELDARSWDVERRLADMDADGIEMQVLSPMPELLSYWFSADQAERIADHVNAHIGEMIARRPDRFCGLGMVPLQDPSRAARYLERLTARFGLVGVEIGSNIEGRLPGETRFHPVFAAAEALDLCVFVHALHPIATRAADLGPEFAALVGFPLDVGMAGASFIVSGLMQRHPRLRVALSHGGGAMASLLGRLDQGWSHFPAFRERLTLTPSLQARTLFYDSNVYDGGFLRYLAVDMAPGRVCIGTDYPYLVMQADPQGFVASCGFDAQTFADVGRRTALAFLGRDTRPDRSRPRPG